MVLGHLPGAQTKTFYGSGPPSGRPKPLNGPGSPTGRPNLPQHIQAAFRASPTSYSSGPPSGRPKPLNGPGSPTGRPNLPQHIQAAFRTSPTSYSSGPPSGRPKLLMVLGHLPGAQTSSKPYDRGRGFITTPDSSVSKCSLTRSISYLLVPLQQ